MIRDLGFVTTGTPTIYLQQPSGKVLLRRDTYDGPEFLAQAIRRARPDYDPSKDPDGRAPAVPEGFVPPIVACVAGVLLLLVLLTRRYAS
jgi:hypothetical protein